MRTSMTVGLLAVLFLLGTAHTCRAQTFDTFMLVPGINGSSADARHRNWIDLLSVAQAMTASTDLKKVPLACNVTVAKSLDTAGPPLWAAAALGQVFPDITIEVQRGGDRPGVFYTLHLGNARIASILTKIESASAPVEQLVITPQTATLEFRPQNPDGTSGSAVTSTITCTP